MNFKTTGFVATFLLAVSLCPILHGQITITPSNLTVGVGTNELVTLTASGTDIVTSADVIAIINNIDGTAPTFSSTGGILGQSIFSVAPNFGTNIPQAIDATFVPNPFGSIDGEDFLSLSFDTSALSPTDTFEVALEFNGTPTLFVGADGAIETNFVSPFTVTVVGDVPEPSSIVFLLATGSLAMLRRRKIA